MIVDDGQKREHTCSVFYKTGFSMVFVECIQVVVFHSGVFMLQNVYVAQ